MTQSYTAPNIETHVAETHELPAEPNELLGDRPDEPTPSLWQKTVRAKHKRTNEPVVVVRVDWATMLFRPFWPERTNPKTGQKGLFGSRLDWQSCRDYEVEVTFSAAELDRQKAKQEYDAMLARLDPEMLEAAQTFCESLDPHDSIKKLRALEKLGVIQITSAADDTKKPKGAK